LNKGNQLQFFLVTIIIIFLLLLAKTDFLQ